MIKRDQRKPVNLGNIFDRHVKHEFVDHDVDSTMKTMVKEPIVHHVPTMTGGIGFDQVYNFYKTEFVGKMPNDTKLKRISRTIGTDQVVDDLFYALHTIPKFRICLQELLLQENMWRFHMSL